MTLVELMIASAITAVVLTSLCGIYFSVARGFERQQGEADALLATTNACSKLSDYASRAMSAYVIDRFDIGDTLALNMPLDTAHNGLYVPIWNGGKLQCRSGQWLLFYLSDKTGSYNNKGDILWAATVTYNGTYVITPDSAWSLYYDTGQGRVAPIDSVKFTVVDTPSGDKVTINVVASYEAGNTRKQIQQSRTVCLRNSN